MSFMSIQARILASFPADPRSPPARIAAPSPKDESSRPASAPSGAKAEPPGSREVLAETPKSEEPDARGRGRGRARGRGQARGRARGIEFERSWEPKLLVLTKF